MVRLIGPLVVLVLMFGIVACGGDDTDLTTTAAPVTIETASSCAELMDLFMPIVQRLLDSTADMSMAEIAAMSEPPEFVTDFEASVDEISEKSDELDCGSEEMQALFDARVGDLTANGEAAEFLLESINEIDFD